MNGSRPRGSSAGTKSRAWLRKLLDLPDVRELWLGEVQLDTLSSLTGFENLQSTNCSNAQVSDLVSLAALPALQSVDCSATLVSVLAPGAPPT